MTMTQLAVGVALLLGGLWAVQTFTMGNLRDDVSSVHAAVIANQDRNADTRQYATAADGELHKQLADLTAELRTTNSRLASLNENISNMDVRLTRSIDRQEAFERSMLVRLGPAGTDRTTYKTPMDWGKSEGAIYEAISTGSDPLVDWYKSTTER